MPVMITLNKIRAASLPDDIWEEVLKAHVHLGMDTEFPLSSVLDSNDLEDAVWCFDALPEYIEIPQRFALWCVRDVQHLMKDEGIVDALDIAERYLDGNATMKDVFDGAYTPYTRDYTSHINAIDILNIVYAASAAVAARVVDACTYVTATTRQKQIDKLKEMLNE
jgi:hypothetical protein